MKNFMIGLLNLKINFLKKTKNGLTVLCKEKLKMKTEETKQMEQGLVKYCLQRNEAVGLEVPYIKQIKTSAGLYGSVGQWEYIDAVSCKNNLFTCYELKVSLNDFHSKAKQSYHGNRNFLVVPEQLVDSVKNELDKDVGILAWNGESQFRIAKKSKIDYQLTEATTRFLALSLIDSMKKMMKDKIQNSERHKRRIR